MPRLQRKRQRQTRKLKRKLSRRLRKSRRASRRVYPRRQRGGAVLPGTVVGTMLGGDEDAVPVLVGADRLEEVVDAREGGFYEPEETLVSQGAAPQA